MDRILCKKVPGAGEIATVGVIAGKITRDRRSGRVVRPVGIF